MQADSPRSLSFPDGSLSLNVNTGLPPEMFERVRSGPKPRTLARQRAEGRGKRFARSLRYTQMNGTGRAANVFTIAEIARAAGVSLEEADRLFTGGILPRQRSGFVAQPEAVDAVRLLRIRHPAPAPDELFQPAARARPEHAVPLAASGAMHAAFFGLVLLAGSLAASAPAPSPTSPPNPARLVFLATPGPGGGGGGGGLKNPLPPRPAALKGKSALKSPVPPRAVKSERPRTEPLQPPKPAEPVATETPAPPPPPIPHEDPAPPVVAPVAPVAGDAADRAGDVTAPPPDSASRGPGTGGGSGTGTGTGNGAGDGAGIGEGTGGGTGGGPYRPGSGITPPRLLREVKPFYTDEARRRNLQGDVLLEVVVRSDGSVGNVRVLRRLGAGLDQSAVDAVRQWKFAPALRFGKPVDVIVEVGVEFGVR